MMALRIVLMIFNRNPRDSECFDNILVMLSFLHSFVYNVIFFVNLSTNRSVTFRDI